jgi:tetratricopeptide (TPR) repeat protein
LYELAFQFIGLDNKRALAFIEDAEEAALSSHDSLWIVKSVRVKGQILSLLERTDEAMIIFRDVLPIAVRNHYTDEEYVIESGLATAEIFTGAYDKALRRFDRIMTIVIAMDNKDELATTLNKIGLTYYKLQDYRKALTYYKRAVADARRLQGKLFGLISGNIALCYAQIGDFDNARVHNEISLNACGVPCNDGMMKGIEYTYAVISLGEGRMEEAEKHLLRSLSLARSTKDSRFQFDNIYLLADLHLERKAFRKAEEILVEAEELIKRGTPFNLEKIKIFSRLSQLYLATHDYRKASYYQSKYILFKDSVYNDDLTTSLMKAEASFHERENEIKLAAQERIITLDRQMIKAQRWLSLLSVLVAMLSITIVVVLYRSYRKKETINSLLDLKVQERTKDLEASQNQMLTAIEQQRLMLARASAAMREKVNRLKGLCSIARLQLSDPVAQGYANKITDASLEIELYLKFVMEEQTSTVLQIKR